MDYNYYVSYDVYIVFLYQIIAKKDRWTQLEFKFDVYVILLCLSIEDNKDIINYESIEFINSNYDGMDFLYFVFILI